MRRGDLHVGDRVWVVLPYSGGRGYAEILELDVPRLERPKPTATVRIRFHPGQSAYGEKLVAPAAIVKRGVE